MCQSRMCVGLNLSSFSWVCLVLGSSLILWGCEDAKRLSSALLPQVGTQTNDETKFLGGSATRPLASTATTSTTTTIGNGSPQATTTPASYKRTLVASYQRTLALDSQFLMQATFGPTRQSIATLGRTTYQEWIKDQMAMPIESHRAYYRERVQPRLSSPSDVGNPVGRCSTGSRWRSVVFTKADYKKAISVRNNTIYVGDVWRTDIDPTGNGIVVSQADCSDTAPPTWVQKNVPCSTKDLRRRCRFNKWWSKNKYCQQSCYNQGAGYAGQVCSIGWPNLDKFDGYICEVEHEAVGGWMSLSVHRKCDETQFQGMENPAFWLAASSQASDAHSYSFKTTSHMPDVLLMTSGVAGSCNLGRFISYNSRYWFHDERLLLIENTLDKPAPSASVSTPVTANSAATSIPTQPSSICATVSKTFLNEKHCQLVSTCTPLHLQKSLFVLNTTSLKRFYDIGTKYAYEVTGLRTSASPCGTLARWVQMDCSKFQCSPTSSIGSFDLKLITDALAVHAGRIRDITVSCSNSGVPANSIVQVNSLYFQHKHLNEHNVYSFDEWVTKHPGGSGKITQFAKRDEFTLHFPVSHPMDRWLLGSTQQSLDYLGRMGDEIDFQNLPSNLQTQELADVFSFQGPAGYFQACGSPNEVASVADKGHEMAFWTSFENGPNKFVDTDYDSPTYRKPSSRQAKQTVWMMKAAHAKDQLRQRMAWALSQIFVTSMTNSGEFALFSEMWVSYYDIFVRHAFGNFRDILREATYSPVMGDYLTYRRNKAYDIGNTFPDENYAREIMQLFTIGLWQLNLDGSRKKDSNGGEIPTYDNEDIMSFARVFTGFDRQLPRANIEHSNVKGNMIDPMQMKEAWHDVYPKPDLDGNYLGDGYPLCADVAPRAFLNKDAQYTFIGFTYAGSDVMIASSNSSLFLQLCNGPASNCNFSATVTLGADIACFSFECKMDTVQVVKVASGYYEYVPPACVHLFLYNGKIVAHGASADRFTSQQICENPDTMAAGTSCCKGCTNLATSWMNRQQPPHTCENANVTLGYIFRNKCNQDTNWKIYKYCQQACWDKQVGYSGDDCSGGAYAESRICGHQNERVRYAVADASCSLSGQRICNSRTSTGSCGYDRSYLWTTTTCTLAVEVDVAGKISLQTDDDTKQNKIAVQWTSGFPTAANCPSTCTATSASCICGVTVSNTKVFDRVPTVSELQSQLKVGAFAPATRCTSSCTGDVKVYAASGSSGIDEDTVFEHSGRFYRNVKSKVDMAGYEFRNPPVFMIRRSPRARDALLEVESLLDHLFRHPNTAMFISYRLIQRLVTSNPSAKYLQDVAVAFRSGTYAGIPIAAGQYGDLAPTLAAILLHPEARDPPNKETFGKLREPLVKLVHVLRALEYQDARQGELVFTGRLLGNVGQAPYEYPSVFNFYKPDYQPPRFPSNLVAPEFEIFTPPAWLQYLNGMMSLIDLGLSSCHSGFGTWSGNCVMPSGTFQVHESSTLNATFAELSLLLTGGQLTSFDNIYNAYHRFAGNSDEGFKAAQKVIIMSPEFNVLGTSLHNGTRAIPQASPSPAPASYKAMVLLWLGGGADTFNLLVPHKCSLYDQYVEARKNIALTPSELHEIDATGQVCTKFGIHKNLPYLKELYDAEEAAFVSNIGALVEPTTKQTFNDGLAKRCVGLFSHSDQTLAAHTLQCQTAGASPKGAGGRMGDALASRFKTTSFSIAGTATWSSGFQITIEIIDKTHGSIRHRNYAAMQYYVANITSKKHSNVISEEYVQQFGEAIASSESLGAFLDSVVLQTTYPASTGLGQQLRQVCRLMATRIDRKAERDFFFVQLGGFDTHRNVVKTLVAKYAEINLALQEYVAEVKALGLFDSTVLLTQSDFGRTLTSNSGGGTDHAWAGNHFVIGGKLRGKHIFNSFPTSLQKGGDQDAGRGRLIPGYPWESVLVPIADWMGVQASQHSMVFPNLGNFNSSHIIETTALFIP